jgi:hypothetical protein
LQRIVENDAPTNDDKTDLEADEQDTSLNDSLID